MAYWSKFNTSDDGIIPIGSNLYGVCTTASATTTKVVTMSDFDVLVEGVTIHVYFQHKNTASNPVLQVGSTTGKQIRYNGNQGGLWDDSAFISFTYYQDYWVQNDILDDGSGGETYTLSISGHTITLTGDGGTTSSVTVPDNDTHYGLSYNASTGSVSIVENGGSSSITISDANHTNGGLMSAADKIKLDSIEAGATKVQIIRW